MHSLHKVITFQFPLFRFPLAISSVFKCCCCSTSKTQ
ncbi:hypothetical protein RDI58_011400 [Solanum bulbocastanum]|uniref:Uncharacterized protein n=1 Tax=Solanum bulbocastanum TaxID=147425 RepID=A0AAN8TSQ4_SOLBU